MTILPDFRNSKFTQELIGRKDITVCIFNSLQFDTPDYVIQFFLKFSSQSRPFRCIVCAAVEEDGKDESRFNIFRT